MTMVDSGRATTDAYIQALLTRGAFADYFTGEARIAFRLRLLVTGFGAGRPLVATVRPVAQ